MDRLLLVLAGLLEGLTKALGPRASRWLTPLSGLKTKAHAATVAVTAPAAQAASNGDIDISDHLAGVYQSLTQGGVGEPAIRAPVRMPPSHSRTTVSIEAIPEQEVATSEAHPVELAITGQTPDSRSVAVSQAFVAMPTDTSTDRITQDILPARTGEPRQVPLEGYPSIPEEDDPTPTIAGRELSNADLQPSAPSVSDQFPESSSEAVSAASLAPVLTGAGTARTEPDLSPADTGDVSQEIDRSGLAADVANGAAATLDHDVALPAADDNVRVGPDDTTLTTADCVPDHPEKHLAEDPAGFSNQQAPDSELEAGVDATDGPALSVVDDRPTGTAGHEPKSQRTTEPTPEPPVPFELRSRQPAVHRDRRGKRRTVAANDAPAGPYAGPPAPAVRPPAEARLRLSLHPIRRTARLSVVLTRPDGFPERVTVQAAGSHTVEAYDERRYDDLNLPWTNELLDGELRLASSDRLQWLRSARQVHIFTADPNEPDLISVSAVTVGISHTVLCRSTDVEAVRTAAESTGSPTPKLLEHWQGIPEGWMVLSGYTPMHSAAQPLAASFRPLDPGEGLEINFDGGLPIRARVYAAGHPPKISIVPAPGSALVTIGGHPATVSSDGAWVALGWDTPGQHVVDVVPGPSVSYEIAADPWLSGGWDFWDAYPARFGEGAKGPWARARICGALILGPAGETVIAHEALPTLIALGARSGATPLQQRHDLGVSVGLAADLPAFLLSATGARRTQGRVVWLGLAPTQNASKRHDAEWVSTVRSATARRLPLVKADTLGEDAWRKAKVRARQLRSRRSHT